jgi:AsmA-like C-terminal region
MECVITKGDSSLWYSISGKMHWDGFVLNPRKGAYLKNQDPVVQWNLEFFAASKKLIVHPSSMTFLLSKVNLDGEFSFPAPGSFNLNIHSDKLNYAEGISLLTPALQDKLIKYRIDRFIKVRTSLRGSLAGGSEPAVDVAFQWNDQNEVNVGKTLTVTKSRAEGLFTNHLDSLKERDDHNSVIRIDRLEGIIEGIPVKVSASFIDLKDTRMELKSDVDADLRSLNASTDQSLIRFKGGKITSHLEFRGDLMEILDSTATHYKGSLDGFAKITDGSLVFVPRNQSITRANLELIFDKKLITLKELSAVLNKNTVLLHGEVDGFIPFLIHPRETGSVKLALYSPQLNLTPFKGSPVHKASRKKESRKSRISDLLLQVYDRVGLDFSVKLDKWSYQKMYGSRLSGQVILSKNKIDAQNLTTQLIDGEVNASFIMDRLNEPVHRFFAKASVHNADLKKLWYVFDDFGMKGITFRNLEGKVNLNARLWANVRQDYTLIVPSMVGDVDFSLKNGRLINVEALQNLSNFLFKNRNFNDIAFAEIKSRVHVIGASMDISKMQVASSVIHLFLEGQYAPKYYDMEVQIPLSNLKKRDKNYKPQNVVADAKVGPSIYLHITRGSDGKANIAYDPFKKYARKTASK